MRPSCITDGEAEEALFQCATLPPTAFVGQPPAGFMARLDATSVGPTPAWASANRSVHGLDKIVTNLALLRPCSSLWPSAADLSYGPPAMMDNILPTKLVEAARKVVDANRLAGRTIAIAESCTGGLVSTAITEIPGSSEVLSVAFVTYSNDAKTAHLKVSRDVLETFGAVSIATAWSMAQGALQVSGADVAVAITGIAGPGGGSEKKPVGYVVFARAEKDADPDVVVPDTRDFGDLGRGGVRLQAALCALELLLPGDPAAPEVESP